MPVVKKLIVGVAFTDSATGRVIKVTDQAPITLSGDRRRWPKEIEAYLVQQAAEVAAMISRRLSSG